MLIVVMTAIGAVAGLAAAGTWASMVALIGASHYPDQNQVAALMFLGALCIGVSGSAAVIWSDR